MNTIITEKKPSMRSAYFQYKQLATEERHIILKAINAECKCGLTVLAVEDKGKCPSCGADIERIIR